MPHIPREIVDTVRDRVDIVEIISRHLSLQRRGSNYLGLCPFHQEKTPSFNVIPSKGIYHCFGCQAGGDVFEFVMNIEGLSFVEAVKDLASSVGVEVPERELTPTELAAIRKRATLYEVLEEAADFYASVLWTHSDGRAAREYLESRKINAETIKRARLGYAPDGWSRLLDHLHAKGYPPERCVEAGLAREGRQRSCYDTFRDRVVFPIYDDRGRIIGFGGRLMEGDGPKYINSPETRLYHKSKVLYGIEIARAAAQKKDQILIVEGYFDVLALQQAGFNHAVATCGTALTNDHMTKIRRLTTNAVVITDADEAGARAAERSLPLFLKHDLQPWRVNIPGAKDPDELLRESGSDAFEEALSFKEPLVEWVLKRRLATAGGVMGREQLIQELMPILVRLPPGAISAIAARLGNERALLERIAQARSSVQESPPDIEPEPVITWRPHRDITHILWLLVHRYDQVADLMQRVDPAIFNAHAPARPAVARLMSGEPVAAVIAEAGDVNVKRTLLAVVGRETLYTVDEAPLAICQILNRLSKPASDAALSRLTNLIEEALTKGKTDKYREHLQQRAEMTRLRGAITSAIQAGEIEPAIQRLTSEAELLKTFL